MDEQRQDNQLEPMSVQDVALNTYQERQMIETSSRRGSGRSVLAAQHDDDN